MFLCPFWEVVLVSVWTDMLVRHVQRIQLCFVPAGLLVQLVLTEQAVGM